MPGALKKMLLRLKFKKEKYNFFVNYIFLGQQKIGMIIKKSVVPHLNSPRF